MKHRKLTLVPRNPYAVLASKRKAGSHRKTNKQLRMAGKYNIFADS